MKEVTIFALGHKIVKISDEAIKMDVVNPESPASYGSVAHGGCSIVVDKIQDKILKKELEDLQIHLKKQNSFGTILACVNKVQK
ncbi:MAG: hypothetical protein L3J43_08545 [Sulfurovum sp.]|nr:hypothetical protein [Sulfurovum sp.]